MRIRTRSLIIMLSRGLTQATTLALAVVLVRLMSKELFGTYRQVLLVQAFVVGGLSLQLGNSLYYFLPKLGDQRRRGLVLQTFMLTFLMAGIVAGVMFIGSDHIAGVFKNPRLAGLIRIFSLYPFAERLVTLVPAFMISMDRPWRGGAYSLVAAVGRFVAVVGSCWLGWSLSGVMWAVILVGFVVGLVGCWDMLRLSPGGGWRISRQLLVEQLQYCWPLLATAVVGVVNVQFDRLLISTYFDAGVYAVYSCGAMQLPVLALVTTSVGTAMMPNLVTRAGRGDIGGAISLWQEAARKCSLIVFPCFAFFMLVGPDFMILLYGDGYARAAWPFGVYLLMLPIRAVVYAGMFRALGRTRPIACGAILALIVNVVLSTVLVWAGRGGLLSFVGPSLGTVISVFFMVAYLLWALSRITTVPISRLLRWGELGRVFFVSVLAGIGVLVIPLPPFVLFVKLLVQGLLFASLFVLLTWSSRLLKDDERAMLQFPVRALQRVLGR